MASQLECEGLGGIHKKVLFRKRETSEQKSGALRVPDLAGDRSSGVAGVCQRQEPDLNDPEHHS